MDNVGNLGFTACVVHFSCSRFPRKKGVPTSDREIISTGNKNDLLLSTGTFEEFSEYNGRMKSI